MIIQGQITRPWMGPIPMESVLLLSGGWLVHWIRVKAQVEQGIKESVPNKH